MKPFMGHGQVNLAFAQRRNLQRTRKLFLWNVSVSHLIAGVVGIELLELR